MMFTPAFLVVLPFVVSIHAQFQGEVVVNHHPHKISYDALIDQDTFQKSGADASFVDALSEYGIISITNIPGYLENKKNTLQFLHACAVESSAAKEHTFSDGTVRLTMATQTVPGPGGQQEIKHKIPESSVCSAFSDSSEKLRIHVQEAVLAFSARLSSVLKTSVPLLSTKNDDYDFNTFEDVVENGDHLEHFHSYQRTATDNKSGDTIDIHTDQGVFIAFVPAVMVDTTSPTTTTNKSMGDFYIEMKDGSRALVDFDEDDLVIMLGDGVNQYVNPKVEGSGVSLRATPHALVMRNHDNEKARVWYGRMVLPPSDAVHPEHQETFGHMRQLMIDASLSSTGDDILGLGCSGNSVAHQLEEVVCMEGSTYCWHRCMNHSDYEVSDMICSERSLQLQCVNPRDQVYESGHGDFQPACSNSIEPVTDYPTLSSFPQDTEKCDEKAWDEFSSPDGYSFIFDKLGDNRGNRGLDWDGAMEKGGNSSKFMWNVDGDSVDGKLVFNGLFGWLAFGFLYPGGKHNGMNGASIIMAVPGGNYSAKLGLDMSMNETVEEYVIHLDGSSFRHWSDPLQGRDVSSYNVASNECFTALTFNTESINDIKFNISGTDGLLWGANKRDNFVGYHGRGGEGPSRGAGDRDVFNVEWNTGKAWFPPPAVEDEDEEETIPSSSGLGLYSLTALVMSVVIALLEMI